MEHFGGAFVSGRQDGWGRKPAFSMGPSSTLSTPGTPREVRGTFPKFEELDVFIVIRRELDMELTVENRVLGSGCAGHSLNFLYIDVSGAWSFFLRGVCLEWCGPGRTYRYQKHQATVIAWHVAEPRSNFGTHDSPEVSPHKGPYWNL